MRYPDYLVHYNPNHDKRTGRFTFSTENNDYKSYAKYDKSFGGYKISTKYLEKDFNQTVSGKTENINEIRSLGSEIKSKKEEYDKKIRNRLSEIKIDDETLKKIPEIVASKNDYYLTDWELFANAIADHFDQIVWNKVFEDKTISNLRDDINSLSKKYDNAVNSVIGDLANKYRNIYLTDYSTQSNVSWDGKGYINSVLASKNIDANVDNNRRTTSEVERIARNDWSDTQKHYWDVITKSANKVFDEVNK